MLAHLVALPFVGTRGAVAAEAEEVVAAGVVDLTDGVPNDFPAGAALYITVRPKDPFFGLGCASFACTAVLPAGAWPRMWGSRQGIA